MPRSARRPASIAVCTIVAQRGVELQTRRDHQHGVDQAVEPVSALDDLLDAVLDLDEQLTQSQLRQRVTQRTRSPRSSFAPSSSVTCTIVAPAVALGRSSVRRIRCLAVGPVQL